MKKKEVKQMEMAQNDMQMKPKKKKKRKKWPIVVGVLVGIYVLLKVLGSLITPPEMAIVTTTNAVTGDLQDSVSVTGTVAGENKKTLFSNVSGKIADVKVSVGDSVESGELLLLYDMADMDEKLEQAQLQYNKSDAGYQSAVASDKDSKAKLSEAKTNLKVLEQQIKDYTALVERLQEQIATNKQNASVSLSQQANSLSAQATALQKELNGMNESDAGYAEKAQKLAEVSESLKNVQIQQQLIGTTDSDKDLQKQLKDAQEKLADFQKYKAEMETQKKTSEASIMDSYDKDQISVDKTLINKSLEQMEADYALAQAGVTAEFAAVVTSCNVVPGATLTEGMQMMTLESTDAVKVSFAVTKNVIAKLEIGQKAEVTIFDKVYEGEVVKINRMATTNQMSQSAAPMVGVEVKVLNPDENIILGLDAKVLVYTQKAEAALLIPVEAINADKNGDFVYVVENGLIARKDIVCGISSDTQTQILEGITAEDVIVLSSLTNIEEGMPATVLPEDVNMAELQELQQQQQ
ncbi:MAG: HlyD family efflux transporter periplasmic adaptor subunit [Lachnospiraceae bacterium]|nr:HlyD family efflux transporter periplasmic adaptor subunit [Lachnospiraceae bacterium]